MLTTLAGIRRADIQVVAGREALELRYVSHQLTVNRCLLAIRPAWRAQPGVALNEWTADPHARVGYRAGRTWRKVHPDAVAELVVDGHRRWMYLEVDRGTAELRRYDGLYQSGSWRSEYEQFPEIWIVTAHRPRVPQMVAELEDAVRSFRRADIGAMESGLKVTVDWESAFLAILSAAVWAPTLWCGPWGVFAAAGVG